MRVYYSISHISADYCVCVLCADSNRDRSFFRKMNWLTLSDIDAAAAVAPKASIINNVNLILVFDNLNASTLRSDEGEGKSETQGDDDQSK